MSRANVGLWGHRDFMRLWTAQAISTFGARIAREGLPMAAVVTLQAGPEAVGLFAALRLGSQGLAGLIAGPLADRLPRRALLVGADLARAAVLTLVPLAALIGRLTLAEIFLAGVLMGAFNVVFDVADHAFLPSLLAHSELVEGNAKLATTEAVAEVAGPALYGALFSLMAPPLALGVNAATYLASAALLGRIRGAREAHPALPDGEPPASLLRGFGAALAHPLVRPLWLADVTRAFFGGFFSALYILFAFRWLHLTAWMFGITVALGGVGGLAGATLAPRLLARLGFGRAILLAGASGAALQVFVPLASGAPLVAMGFLCVAQLFGDGLQTAADIGSVSLRQSLVPAHELGRVGGAFASGQGLMGVAGALAGGWAGAALGPRGTLYLAAAGLTAASAFVALSPLRRLRTPAQAPG